MLAIPAKHALRAALLVAALAGVTLAFAVDGMRSMESRGYILSHLPEPGSAGYEEIRRAAGAPSGRWRCRARHTTARVQAVLRRYGAASTVVRQDADGASVSPTTNPSRLSGPVQSGRRRRG